MVSVLSSIPFQKRYYELAYSRNGVVHLPLTSCAVAFTVELEE